MKLDVTEDEFIYFIENNQQELNLSFEDDKFSNKQIEFSVAKITKDSPVLIRRLSYVANKSQSSNKFYDFKIIIWNKSNYLTICQKVITVYLDKMLVKVQISEPIYKSPDNFFDITSSLFFDKISDAVMITEAEPMAGVGPRIIYVNKQFTLDTGYRFEDVFGKTPRILQGEKTSKVAKKTISKNLSKWQHVREELVNYKKNGDEFRVDLSITPVRDSSGWYDYWIAIQRDITQKEELHRKMLLEEKLSDLGIVSSSIAHEINNPLMVILNMSKSVIRRLSSHDSDNGKMINDLNKIVKNTERIRNIIYFLKILGRDLNYNDFETVSFTKVYNEALDIIRDKIDSSGVVIKAEFEERDIFVNGLPLLISLLISNLISNAIDVLQDEENKKIRIKVEHLANGLSFSITDSGKEITKELEAKLGTPFFTTKTVNKGTGLGLYICKKIVNMHGGVFHINKNGYKFVFEFPL